VVLNPANRYQLPVVRLDPAYYRFVDQLEARFPAGAPSLTACEELRVTGDVLFGGGVRVQDSALVSNRSSEQARIPDGAIITGEVSLGG
jgi:UTP--glucose-1-phosphate uridylyltransferase